MPKVRVFKPHDFDGENAPPIEQFHPLILAEGDSWFTLGAVPAFNLLEQLDFPSFGGVINLAYPGDTVMSMEAALKAGSSQRRIDVWASELGRWIADSAAYPLNAILLSGGGNDLIDAFPHLLKSPCDYTAVTSATVAAIVDADALAKFDAFLAQSFTGIVNFVRDHGGPNANVPIFCHTYDYPTPNDSPATILGARLGSAWMFPRLTERGVPQVLWVPLADFLLEHMAGVLKGLALPDFHVVNTLNTLSRAELGARRESGDWSNEIHPNRSGYKKLARKVSLAIAAELGLQEKPER